MNATISTNKLSLSLRNHFKRVCAKKLLKTVLVLFMLSFLSACLPSSNNSSGPSRIAVISAFGAELEMLLAQVKTPQAHIINGRTFTTGVLRGKQVVLLLSGVSIINATLNTQIAIDYFNISHIVFSGIAGGVNPSLNIGDVTVPTEWANYQKQTFANGDLPDGPWTVRSSETTKFGNFGMAFPQYISITRKNEKPDQLEKKFWFEVDLEMLAVARQVALEVQLERCDSFNRCFTQAPVIRTGGRGVSGPTFVNNRQYREWVWSNFQDGNGNGVNALDMESSAVAAVAYINAIPFIAFRSISDLAGGGGVTNEIEIFRELASNNAATVTAKFLEDF